LKLLKMVSDAAHSHDIWVGVCGEMAGDLAMVPLLLGLGMDELSVSASLVPRVKKAVQTLALPECEQLVHESLQLDTPAEILALCAEVAQRHYGDLIG
jgi:phosphotransferase system enzyme I (PtsI)